MHIKLQRMNWDKIIQNKTRLNKTKEMYGHRIKERVGILSKLINSKTAIKPTKNEILSMATNLI